MKMNCNNYCVIMAGGIGSRFWPMSRINCPKQFVDILGIGKTFIQMTYERFASFIPAENFIVVTGKDYKKLVLEQLPEITESQILLEPARRNTAPCLAYAAFKIRSLNPNAVMVVTPADHLILNTDLFTDVIKTNLIHAADTSNLFTVGIKPSFPSTGYGYIEKGQQIEELTKVKSFKEKPNYELACQFLQEERFLWNSGMFIWSVSSILQEMKQYIPSIASAFENISEYYGSPEEQLKVDNVYSSCESISIDYAIMEKSDNVYVTEGDFGWSDLGTWTSLYQQQVKDKDNNVFSADYMSFSNCSNCMVKELNPEKLVVVDGVDDLLVVDTKDVLFICPRQDENFVKKTIENATLQNEKFK